MDDYAGRVLADRYRLPAVVDAEPIQTRAFDTYSGQDVLIRQVPLPEVVEAELVEDEGGGRAAPGRGGGRGDPAVQRAMTAARAAAAIPDHPRLDQVFDVFEDGGSLWIVSELVPARPLARLLAERPLSPYRGAEVAADILTALRALHAHGWTHRNITPRTVLICDDGRVVLTGLASGAAEEALCGYDPLPAPPGRGEPPRPTGSPGPPPGVPTPRPPVPGPGAGQLPDGRVPRLPDPASGFLPAQGARPEGGYEYGQPSPHGHGHRGQSVLPPPGDTALRRPPGHGPPAQTGGRAAIAEAQAAETPQGPPAGAPSWPDGHLRGPGGVHAGGPPGEGPPPGAGARHAAAPGAGHAAGGHTAAPGAGPGAGHAADESTDAAGGHAAAPGAGPGAGHAADESTTGGARHGAMAAYRAGAQAAAAHIAAGPEYSDRIELRGSGPHAPQGPVPQGPVPQDAAPEDAQPAPTPPGSATYGGSLPGARPGASIAVSVSTQPPAQPPAQAAAADEPEDTPPGPGGRLPGPATRLAAERARHTRMQVVGPITERWAPEQAGPVHQHWQLAPPVGPAADLWALGALLFRAVQGHPAYPEEDAAELVQLVCSEPPAHAEECGALRPVVESLLRQDPTERPDFEELRGWLRSLIRTAPEPGIGSRTVTVPPLSPGRASDPRRLPILRRRGELMRRRRAEVPALSHGRHKRKRGHHGPRSLGRVVIALIFLAMAGAITYAVLFMPKAGESAGERRSVLGSGSDSGSESDTGGDSSAQPRESSQADSGSAKEDGERNGEQDGKQDKSQKSAGAGLPTGFELREDPAGFEIGVRSDWRRLDENDRGQIRYVGGDFELVIVPGRDPVEEYGTDPMAYQQDSEPELAAFRDAAWSTASDLRRIDVGQRAMAEGEFSWSDESGRKVYARNLAMLLDRSYHVLLVLGPEVEDREVARIHEVATETYRPTG